MNITDLIAKNPHSLFDLEHLLVLSPEVRLGMIRELTMFKIALSYPASSVINYDLLDVINLISMDTPESQQNALNENPYLFHNPNTKTIREFKNLKIPGYTRDRYLFLQNLLR